MEKQRTYYKLVIGGITYLVDPATSQAYTYDLTAPTQIGTVHWADPKEQPTIMLRNDWKDVMAQKLATTTACHPTQPHTPHNAATTTSHL